MSSEYTFAQAPQAQIPRSAFNRSHGVKTTFDGGYLVPVLVDEVLPGDTFVVNGSFLARLSTPLVPAMDNIYLDIFYFFVPNRLLWTNWQKFMGEQANPGDSTDFILPYQTSPAGGWNVGTVQDYFGIPTGVQFGATLGPCALPVRAYFRIWNEWFRDENLQNRASLGDQVGDGPDAVGQSALLQRGKRHDYFTSCLPWPQKPGPGAAYANGVAIPLGGYAKVSTPAFMSAGAGAPAVTPVAVGFLAAGGTAPNYSQLKISAAGASAAVQVDTTVEGGAPAAGNILLGSLPQGALFADLSAATGATINALRQAFQIQKLLERDARGGTRYIEIVRSHFGVTSPDARLQRPEYLGGGTVPVVFNSVAQTSPKPAAGGTVTPQGNLAAFASAGASGVGFSKSFVEHGFILGMICARSDLSYQQGLHRMWSRRTKYDFYWPALAHLGEMAVLNKEIYADASANDELVFGYQERWAEYRYAGSKITGKFRSVLANGLDVWHYAQKFVALPTLGDTFMKETPPFARNQAVTTEPQFILDAHFQMKCVRPMPTYSVPGMLDHF